MSASPHNSAQAFDVFEGDADADRGRKPTPLEYLDPITLQKIPVPERRWIVDGLIPRGAVTMLGGDGGVGKTLLAQMLLTAAATDKNWLGLPVAPVKTLAVFCEDDAEELHRRQAAINDHLGVEFGDLEYCRWLPRCGHENTLLTFPEIYEPRPTELWGQIGDATREFGPEVVLLDSLHDLFAGNENHRGHARAFVALLRGLAIEIDGAVLLTAHPSRAGLSDGSGFSGSTAWNAAVRSRLYLERPEEDEASDDRVLRTKKSNYGPTGGEIPLRWRDGVFVRTDEPTGVVGAIKRTRAEKAFLETLEKMGEAGVEVTDARNGKYAPREMRGYPTAAGLKVRELERAMKTLFADGIIRIETVGKPSKSRKRIIAVEVEADDDGDEIEFGNG